MSGNPKHEAIYLRYRRPLYSVAARKTGVSLSLPGRAVHQKLIILSHEAMTYDRSGFPDFADLHLKKPD